MSRKNRKAKQSVENEEPSEPRIGPADADAGSEGALPDSGPASPEPADGVETPTETEPSTEAEALAPDAGPESADEDPLADVRQSLIEDEAVEKKKKPRWWKRMIEGRPKAEESPADEQMEPELLAVVSPDTSPVSDEAVGAKAEEYEEQIDELIDLLTPGDEAGIEAPADEPAEAATSPEQVSEPVQRIDVDELKRQAFRPGAPGEEPESLNEVREIALEGDEQVFVEVEAKVQDPLQERLSALENALKPYSRYINIVFAFLGIVMAVIAGLLLYNIYQETQPVATPAAVSNLPYPTAVSLPGGWSFNLGRGKLQNGQWNPQGAEWLEGTEVCRWVALPWSTQLEAVIRTLQPDDVIEVLMSNNDRLTYRVYSVRQLTTQEMFDLDSNTPCLLVVLAAGEPDSRWVLTALP